MPVELLLVQIYRLITFQEVTKALWVRKNEKMRRCEAIRHQHDQLRRGVLLADVAKEEMQRRWRGDFNFFCYCVDFCDA
uniref:Uncharacterized protein n=1 Tax=Oryza glumipatula TaxID=40148 RepID=A0A0D9Z8I0_9ORYZ